MARKDQPQEHAPQTKRVRAKPELALALARQEERTYASSEGADVASDGYAVGAADITCAD